MARIAGVHLPNEKRVVVGLTYVYGVGLTTAEKILNDLKIDENIRVKDLNDEQINKLREVIEKQLVVEGSLRRDIAANVKRLKEIKSYRGSRHAKKLPCHGQKTKTNSRTTRGNRKVTLGSGRKPGAQKT